MAVGIVGGDPVAAQHRVDGPEARGDGGLGRLRVAGGALELARGGLSLRGLGGDHGEAGDRHLGGISAGLDAARPAASRPAGWRRAPERLDHDHRLRPLVLVAAQQVAPVVEPEPAGHVQLDAGEAIRCAHRPDPTGAPARLVAGVSAA